MTDGSNMWAIGLAAFMALLAYLALLLLKFSERRDAISHRWIVRDDPVPALAVLKAALKRHDKGGVTEEGLLALGRLSSILVLSDSQLLSYLLADMVRAKWLKRHPPKQQGGRTAYSITWRGRGELRKLL